MSQTAEILILHVDDDPDLTDLTADMLTEQAGQFSVETAMSASEGLDRLAEDDFDCIVSDYQMPGQNGIEFLETVREAYPDLPFILYTGEGSEAVASDAISAGVTDYLQKETGTGQYTVLANRIRNAVEKRRSERAHQRHLEAIKTAHEGISILDQKGRFRYVNEAYADLYGYEPEELVGKHWEVVYPAGEVDIAHEEILPAVEETGSWSGITTGLRSDGSTFREDHRVAATDHNELVCTVQDITERKQCEQELGRTSTILRTIIENLPMGVLVEDADSNVLMANDRLGETLGTSITGDEIIGRDCGAAAEEVKDLFADPERFIDDITERLEQRALVQNEELILADGRILERDYVPYSLPSGEGNLWLYRDATERKRREQKLNTHLKAMEASIDGIALLNSDGEYSYVNEAHAEIYGYDDPETFVGETWRICYDDDTVAHFDKEIIPTLRETGSWRGEATGIRKDGSTFPQELSLAVTDEDGIICVVRDITERKEHEDTLEQLHDATRDLMTATTTEEVATIASETATQVLDHPMNGIHLYDAEADALVPAICAAETKDLLDGPPPTLPLDHSLAGQVYQTGDAQNYIDLHEVADTFLTDTPFRSEYICPLGDHGVFIVSSRAPDAFDAAEKALAEVFTANVEAAFDHVEQRQQLERERDRLDKFASIISHDLRNPLSVATGHFELVQAECDSDHLDDIARAHGRMETLIDEILTLAREGAVVDTLEAVDLADVVGDCWRTVETGEATLTVETTQTLQADPNRLRQLLKNLIQNAAQHGGEKAIVSIGDLDERNGFYIADDGPGIPMEEREMVFEAGYSTTDDGTGFGLDIVRQIVDAHGWDITVTESEAGGARIEITNVEWKDQ